MFKVLKSGRFARLWVGQTLSFTGDWLDMTALYSLLAFRWQVSAIQMSLFGLAMALPWVVVGPLAGVYADRWNRKTTMIVADLVRAVAVLGYIVASDIWQVYAIVVFKGVVSTFFSPSRTSTIKQIVESDELLAANALSSLSQNATKIVGPGISGVIVAALGERVCFMADSISFVLSALFILSVVIPEDRAAAVPAASDASAASASAPVSAPAPARRHLIDDFRAGLALIRSKPMVTYVTTLLALTIFSAGCFDSVSAVFIRDVFGPAPVILGLMMGSIGLGTAISAVWVGTYGGRFRPQVLCALGTLGVGLSVAVLTAVYLTFQPGVAPGVGLIFVTGVSLSLLAVTAQTVIQKETPLDLMGRVSATTDSLVMASQLVAFPLSGALATLFGAGPILLGAGLFLTVAGLAAVTRLPTLGRAPSESAVPAQAE